MRRGTPNLSSDIVPPARLRRWERWLLIALFLVSLGLRVAFVHRYRAWVSPTQNEHHVVAENLLAGKGYSAAFQFARFGPTTVPYPLYTYCLAGWYRLTGGTNYYYLMLLQCVLSALVAPVVYLIARHAFSPPTSVLAATLVAFDYFLAITPTYVSQPVLHILLVVVLVWLVYRVAEAPTWGRAAAAGVFFGLAALTKTTVVFFLMFSTIWLWRRFEGSLKSKLACLAVMWVVSAGVIFPWTLRNWLVFGRFIPISSTFGMHVWIGSNARANGGQYHEDGRSIQAELSPALQRDLADARGRADKLDYEVSDVFLRHALAYIRENPKRFLVLRFRALFYTFFNQNYWMDPSKPVFIYNPVLKWLTVAMMLTVLAGLWTARPYTPQKALPLLFIAAYALLYAAFHSDIDNRFRLPTDPFLLMFAATVPVAFWRAVAARPAPEKASP